MKYAWMALALAAAAGMGTKLAQSDWFAAALCLVVMVASVKQIEIISTKGK